MKVFELSNFHMGWFCGNFEPSLLKTSEIEVGIKVFAKGEREPEHYQKVATEISCVLDGNIRLGHQTVAAGEVCLIEPGEAADFEAITDARVLVLKFPSIPDDKVVV